MRTPGWPAALADGPVAVRPLRYRDATAWSAVRERNADWLAPWEPLPRVPGVSPHGVAAFTAMARDLRGQARRGQALPFVVTWNDRLVGQVTVGNVVRGPLNSGYVGYWVDERVAGRGIMTTALALVIDHCFTMAVLHRIEANIRPENTASRRVVEKLGFRNEGVRLRYLEVDGAYRDHVSYALTVEDVPRGVWAQLGRRRR